MQNTKLKLLEDNIGRNLSDLRHGNDIFPYSAKAWFMKGRIDNEDFIKIENFSAKDNGKRMRRQATDWEKIFAKDTTDKGLLSKIFQSLLKLNHKKTIWFKNEPKTWTDTSPKKLYRRQTEGMANKNNNETPLHTS